MALPSPHAFHLCHAVDIDTSNGKIAIGNCKFCVRIVTFSIGL